MFEKSFVRALMRGFVTSAVLASASSTAFASYSEVVFFGDSLTDTGNLYASSGNTIPASSAYDNGRFSNGPLWSERLAASLGASASPSLSGGTNYAWAGATVQDYGRLQPEIPQELGMYFAQTGGVASSSALYVILGGANDINDAGKNPATAGANIFMAATAIDNMVEALYLAGARNILVGNLPDIGLTPQAIAGGPAVVAGATGLTNLFNGTLQGLLADTEAKDAGLDIDVLDLYGLMNSAVANPAAYGFTNVTDACYDGAVGAGGGNICASPDSYLFWDAFHPSARAQSLMADAALRAVPEPAGPGLVAAALVAMLWARALNGRRGVVGAA
jgi:phospholipase/lecithinase/hemolysin